MDFSTERRMRPIPFADRVSIEMPAKDKASAWSAAIQPCDQIHHGRYTLPKHNLDAWNIGKHTRRDISGSPSIAWRGLGVEPHKFLRASN
jgi:hypothetical protein